MICIKKVTMLNLFLSFSQSSLFRFNDEVIPKGRIIPRLFDMTPGYLKLNLSITKCAGNCEIELIVFEEVRRNQVFFEADNYQAVCCSPKSNCSNSIHYNDPTPVIRRPIEIKTISDANAIETDILLEKTVTLNRIDISSFRSADIELPWRGIWTVMIANCGPNDVNVDGNATMARRIGYLDDRLRNNHYISILQIIAGILYFAIFMFTIWNSVPRFEREHFLEMITCGVFIFDGFISWAFFYILNRVVDVHFIIVFIFVILHSLCMVEVFYTLFSSLQRPVEIPKFKFSLISIPISIALAFQMYGYINFAQRTTGRWLFGYGKYPALLFITQSFIHFYLSFYAFKHKPNESLDGETRPRLVGLFFGSASMYFIMNFCLFIMRLRSNVISTRKSEWVPWTITPLILFFLIAINGWFVSNTNNEGWVALDSGPNGYEQNDDQGIAPDADDTPFD